MQLKTFQYRLYPKPAQAQQMVQVLNVCRHWYNMCLAERKWSYELEGRRVSKNDQIKQARLYRQTFPQAQTVFSQTLQSVAVDLSKAFDAFFRRVKAGKQPGYPRFKSRNRFHSFTFPQYGSGVKVDGRRLRLYGVGRVAVRWHRPIEGTIKTVQIVHQAGHWYACFACEVPNAACLPAAGKVVGVDVGLSALATLSSGEKIETPHYYRTGQAKLRVLQRKLVRAKRGSHNRHKARRAVQRQHEHIANQRQDYLHKLSTYLVQQYDAIALEDLHVTNMVQNKHLSKSILDSGWSMFRQYLTYKAANAGRVIAFVNPAYTSKLCSTCGAVFQDFDLSTRWVECACGLSLDRDHNAALNILSRAGWDTSVPDNVGRCQAHASVRSPCL